MDPQDQTFMTIHNLTPDANILFASESVLDILGYLPDEVQGRSCFDYFHPDEVPLARSVHSRGVRLDKAAVLHYARIRSKDGRWISCECCFTIVHDVLVASTSIYSGGAKSEGRAITAPQVRRLFSSSPRDPRYQMLEHLSPKFKMLPTEREPRAALVLNRFTRNLTIMFATNAVSSILGLRPDELQDRPFYHCIQENCLAQAIACLESAKKNESIAYLRFWFRDPRQDDGPLRSESPGSEDEDMDDDDDDDDDDEEDEDEEDYESDENDDDDTEDTEAHTENSKPHSATRGGWRTEHRMDIDSGQGSENRGGGFGGSAARNRQRTLPTPPASDGVATPHARDGCNSFELEAVVSCTSDGLMVVLRRARPPIPDPQLPLMPAFDYKNGLFAAPWGLQPIEPYYPPELLYTFRAPYAIPHMPLQEHVKAAGGPPRDQLMRSIQDVAVFAWAVVGINGTLATFGHGMPGNGAQPPDFSSAGQAAVGHFPPGRGNERPDSRGAALRHGVPIAGGMSARIDQSSSRHDFDQVQLELGLRNISRHPYHAAPPQGPTPSTSRPPFAQQSGIGAASFRQHSRACTAPTEAAARGLPEESCCCPRHGWR